MTRGQAVGAYAAGGVATGAFFAWLITLFDGPRFVEIAVVLWCSLGVGSNAWKMLRRKLDEDDLKTGKH